MNFYFRTKPIRQLTKKWRKMFIIFVFLNCSPSSYWVVRLNGIVLTRNIFTCIQWSKRSIHCTKKTIERELTICRNFDSFFSFHFYVCFEVFQLCITFDHNECAAVYVQGDIQNDIFACNQFFFYCLSVYRSSMRFYFGISSNGGELKFSSILGKRNKRSLSKIQIDEPNKQRKMQEKREKKTSKCVDRKAAPVTLKTQRRRNGMAKDRAREKRNIVEFRCDAVAVWLV